MAHIHPTAIIDPRAVLAADVSVGPWCLIEGPVTLGPGCRLFERVSLRGPLVAGARNVFYPHVSLGLEPQDRKYDLSRPGPGIKLGDDNLLREGVTIHRATGEHPTTVGDRNFLMVNCHVAHDSRVSDDCTLVNNVALAGHVELADRVTLGGNAAVHQFCRIGRLAMMSGGAVVTQDVPPFCVVYKSRRVDSLNLVGLRRAGLRAHIDTLRRAFLIFFKGRHTTGVALEIIEREEGGDPLVQEFVAFIRSSKRGVTGSAPVREAAGE
ncbi:MAG: acyl-ACP--UDP-N-acetylglucosamine O-acyltransferase [Planctomycetota bacterium]|nr:acyl-ACP--UDP-N-acetylglucosamine O-acyltransferase [Planctomycetota bacterium]